MKQILALLIIFSISIISAQEISQLHLVGNPESMPNEIIANDIRDTDGHLCAGIIVSSDLTGFDYDSHNGIVKINRKMGEDFLFISESERVIKVYHSGFEPLTIVLNEIGMMPASGKVWKLRITGSQIQKTIPEDEYFSNLTINAEGCEIYLDEKLVARNSYTEKISSGNHSVIAKKGEKYYDAVKEIFLAIDENEVITLSPKPIEGKISVTVKPNDASDAVIYINEELKGNAPLVLPLFVGDYLIRAKRENFLEFSQEFSLAENEQKILTLQMQPYEGSSLQTADRWATVKWISLAASGTLAGVSYYFNSAADQSFTDYQNATTTADALNFRDKTNTNKQMSDVFMYAATAAFSTALISWIIQGIQ